MGRSDFGHPGRVPHPTRLATDVTAAADLLRRAAAAPKCRPCGCAHEALTLARAIEHRDADLDAAVDLLRARVEDVRYDCLGCAVCWPADAVAALQDAGALPASAASCPTDPVAERAGWPPLPGAYTVLRWRAPVAVCTLADDELAARVVQAASPAVGIVGTLRTENLGIERLVRNVTANPNIRFLVVSGTESRQQIGHLPGASLLALAASGVDGGRRILDAPGRRPFLKNTTAEEIEEFRHTVDVVDLIGERDPAAVLEAAMRCAREDPGPADRGAASSPVAALGGYLVPRMTSDPAGFVVIYADRPRSMLVIEHYTNAGILDAVVEGPTAAECYTPLIERGMVSRLDHAAYVGRELARAEAALASGIMYVQDGAPEMDTTSPSRSPGCSSGCGEQESSR